VGVCVVCAVGGGLKSELSQECNSKERVYNAEIIEMAATRKLCASHGLLNSKLQDSSKKGGMAARGNCTP
jgi:hypothetical protein